MKPTLIIMAAGMGSRYGGLKQVDHIGPKGETIIDYSVFDAIRAGFGKIVFIISREIEDIFKEKIGNRVATQIPVEYVIQSLDNLPKGYDVPEGRIKPWGTGHAVYCCKGVVKESFAVINADDFYGIDAFRKVAEFLRNAKDDEKYHYCMIGYLIGNTLTENGYVSRGVCDISEEGYLKGIVERTKIEKRNKSIVYVEANGEMAEIEPERIVSMNMWGFTPSIMGEFESYFTKFLNEGNLEKGEFYLPYVVNELINRDKANVEVIKTAAKWYGVTYREDKPSVERAILEMVKNGEYTEGLIGNGK